MLKMLAERRLRRSLPGALVLSLVLSGCALFPRDDETKPLASATSADLIDALRSRYFDPDGAVMVVAHRGCWKTTAENALSAIRLCRGMGVDMVELDVQRTKDGYLILMHDWTVDRTTNGSGRVSELTLAQIKALRLRAGDGGPDAPLTNEAPPTFAEAMEAARGGILVNVDAKGDVNLQVVDELTRLGLLNHAVLKSAASPDEPTVRALLRTPGVLFMPILREADGIEAADTLARYPRDLPSVDILSASEAYLRRGAPAVRSHGARLWANTLQPGHAHGHVDALALADPDAHWGKLISVGVSMIQTDEPEALMAWLKSCGCSPSAD